ncbi:MAG: hypothetical protein IKD42_05150 [Kiritimatiellae bacterium]|nr:hypothetical protein [Kiritimatiellia bacterium]
MTAKMITMALAGVFSVAAAAAPCNCKDGCKCEKDNCKCESENAEAAASGIAYTPGEGISFNETPIVSAEFSLAFDSKYMTYGVIDGKDPIFTPAATITFFDWVYFGVSAIYDVSRGNGGRKGKYSTLDATVGIAHDFELCEALGRLSVDFNYIYEFIPRRYYDADAGKYEVGDTQYLNLELSLGDLWLEPTLAFERDLMADDGTYVNFEIGHTFTLVGDEENQVLTVRPAIGQGFGNKQRAAGYFYKRPCLGEDPEDSDKLRHAGLMDTTVKCDVEWTINDYLKLGGYVAYYDYLFDGNMRDGARWHNADARGRTESSASSWNIVCGLALTASF